MDFKKLIIGDIFIVNDKMVITTTFTENKVKDWAVSINKSFFIEEFKGKTFIVNKGKRIIKGNVLEVEVSSNISDYKNIHLIVDNALFEELKSNDIIEII